MATVGCDLLGRGGYGIRPSAEAEVVVGDGEGTSSGSGWALTIANTNLKRLSNIIPTGSNIIRAGKTHFCWQKTRNVNLSIISLRDLFIERIIL